MPRLPGKGGQPSEGMNKMKSKMGLESKLQFCQSRIESCDFGILLFKGHRSIFKSLMAHVLQEEGLRQFEDSKGNRWVKSTENTVTYFPKKEVNQ